MRLEIGWRRADDHALACDAARDHPGLVLQIAGPDGKIVAVLRKIGDAVAERQIEFQPGILLCKFQQDGGDAAPAEQRRHGDTQLAAWFGKLIGRERIRSLGFSEHHPAAFIIGAPEIRQALAARGPVDEAHAEALFEKPDMLADHRPGQIERGRRGRERAEIDGFDEHGHARKAIHIQNSLVSTVLSMTAIYPLDSPAVIAHSVQLFWS